MLSLSDKSPGPSWAKNPPISFNIYSSTNPDMVTVFYYPLNDVIPDSSEDNNFSTFQKQLVDLDILKTGVKSMDYIDDEDDVIHIDSEHEFLEALKFAQAYKERNGQSVFLLIDEKSEEEVNESAMIPSEDDEESIIEDIMSTRKIAFDKPKGKDFSMGGGSRTKGLKERKRYKSAKADDKLEPSACCQKYLEKFKEEIVAEVTKNVMKILASASNTADLDGAAKETPEKETRHQPDVRQSCYISDVNPQAKLIDLPKKSANIVSDVPLSGFNQLLQSYAEKAAKVKILDREYSIHKVPNYPHHPAFYGPTPPGSYFPSHPMIPPFYSPLNPMPYVRPGSIMGSPEPSPFSRGNNGLYFNDYTQDYSPICSPDFASVVNSVPVPASAPVPSPAEEKNGDCQKKKPKITDRVLPTRNELLEERKRLVEQAKRLMMMKPNALEIKSTIKKIATPSPKKSSSSKIKNKNKMDKELMMNVKKMCNFKIDDQVQKTSGCKRKSRSTDEVLNLWATRCSLLNHVPGSIKCSPSLSFNRNLENLGYFAMPSLDSAKDEDNETKVVKDAVENKEIQDNNEKNSDQDEQSSDDVSSLSVVSNFSDTRSDPDKFALVFYDKDANDFRVRENSREILDCMTRKDPASMLRSFYKEKEKEASTMLGSRPRQQSDEPKKEVRFEVEVEDIGPDESEELIPELNKRSGGDYSFVSETLPKAKETITESTASADEKNTEKEKSSQQSQEQYQQSSEFYHQNNFSPSLSQPMTESGYEKLYPEKPTTGTKTKSEKKSKDKDSQQKRPSYSATVPNVSAYSFVMKPSAEEFEIASKLHLRNLENLKKVEKKVKELQKKCKEDKKKSKSAQDQYSSAKSSPKHNYPYGCEPPRNFFSLFDPNFVDPHSTASKPRYSGVSSFSEPMPPMYPPPPPYPPNFPPQNSNIGPNPLGPSATNRPINPEQGYFPPPPSPFNPYHMAGSGMHSRDPGSSFDPSQSFPDTIAREAAAQAFVHARQAVNSYIINQLNNKP